MKIMERIPLVRYGKLLFDTENNVTQMGCKGFSGGKPHPSIGNVRQLPDRVEHYPNQLVTEKKRKTEET